MFSSTCFIEQTAFLDEDIKNILLSVQLNNRVALIQLKLVTTYLTETRGTSYSQLRACTDRTCHLEVYYNWEAGLQGGVFNPFPSYTLVSQANRAFAHIDSS